MNKKASLLLDWAACAPFGPVVEVGCLRSLSEIPTDGHSTLYLSRHCVTKGLPFYSCDTELTAVSIANQVLWQAGLAPIVICANGLEILERFHNIAFLYLDGSDEPQDTLLLYAAASIAPQGIVLVDDVQYYNNNTFGKASALIPILEAERVPYTIFDTEPGYKTLVIRLKYGKPKGTPGALYTHNQCV